MNLWVIFLTGLTVGGLTCLAVQGGLLTSVIAAREDETKSGTGHHAIYSTIAFLTTKFLAYIFLGALLGTFGGALNIGGEMQSFMQLLAGIYMILVALNLLNIHPIFRYVIIQPPRFLTRLVRNQSKSKDIFAPAILGIFTVFIPCGATLAMETLAISSANTVSGALIMAAFILGTLPLFFGIGLLTSAMGVVYRNRFLKLAAVIVIFLGLSSINGALVSMNSPFTFQSLTEKFPISVEIGDSLTEKNIQPNVSTQSAQSSQFETNQNPKIEITAGGYEPNFIRVKQGEQVNLTLKSRDAYSCASAFRIPAYGIKKNLGANETLVVSFTPTEKGRVQFNCSMGMYRGIIDII